MNFGPVLTNVNPINQSQQTTVRLNIYGSSLPIPALAVQSVTLTVTLVWNTLPTVDYSDVLPLDYDLEDYQVEYANAVSFAKQGNLGVFQNDDVQKINELISQPKMIRDEIIRLKSGDDNVKSIISDDMLERLMHLKSNDYVIPKSLVIAHSTKHKNDAIEKWNDSNFKHKN